MSYLHYYIGQEDELPALLHLHYYIGQEDELPALLHRTGG